MSAAPEVILGIEQLTSSEQSVLLSAAVWYFKRHARIIADEADDRSALAVARRDDFLELHGALRKLGMPLAPAVLALILGPFMEKSLRTSLEMSAGDFSIFLTRPISATLMGCAALIITVAAVNIAALKSIRTAESK